MTYSPTFHLEILSEVGIVILQIWMLIYKDLHCPTGAEGLRKHSQHAPTLVIFFQSLGLLILSSVWRVSTAFLIFSSFLQNPLGT